METSRLIGLVIPKELASHREARTGIYSFARPSHRWGFITLKAKSVAHGPPTERPTEGHIGFLHPRYAKQWRRRRGARSAFVSLTQDEDHWREVGVPVVGIDYRAVARLAGEYLLDRGHRSFAFYTARRRGALSDLAETLGETVQARGGKLRVYNPRVRYPVLEPPHDDPIDYDRNVFHFLASLEPGSAIVTGDAIEGLKVVETCRRTGIQVPERLSVLAVGDDEMYCHMAFPRLSAIRLPWKQVGYRAAEILLRLLNGKDVDTTPVLLNPITVETRQSTDVYAIEEPRVHEAMRFIRLHARDGINVDDVIHHVAAPRRWLERHFDMLIGRSPLKEIQRVRIESAKGILVDTDRNLETIARACGFGSVTRFSLVFKKATGLSPGRFRKQFHRT